MTEPNPDFDTVHPSGHVVFRSCRGGYLHSVGLAEAAMDSEAQTLAEAVLLAADVSYFKAIMDVRDELVAAGQTPSGKVPTRGDLDGAVQALHDHRLQPE